jgi:hypothetical protein
VTEVGPDLPVARRNRAGRPHLGAPAELAVTFGACLPVTGICVLEEALLTLTPGADGTVDLTLAAVAP